MTETTHEAEPWRELVAMVNKYRETEDGKSYRKELAELRRGGMNTEAEAYAYPYVLPYTQNDWEKTALLRAVGLMSEFSDIKQCAKGEQMSLGHSLYMASVALHGQRSTEPFQLDPANPDAIATRLKQLDNLDLEQAVQVIRALLNLVKKTNVPIDFYALTRMLTRWGKGFSPKSRWVREAPLRDYYRGAKLKEKTSTKNN